MGYKVDIECIQLQQKCAASGSVVVVYSILIQETAQEVPIRSALALST
jgi:hypothetical protein